MLSQATLPNPSHKSIDGSLILSWKRSFAACWEAKETLTNVVWRSDGVELIRSGVCHVSWKPLESGATAVYVSARVGLSYGWWTWLGGRTGCGNLQLPALRNGPAGGRQREPTVAWPHWRRWMSSSSIGRFIPNTRFWRTLPCSLWLLGGFLADVNLRHLNHDKQMARPLALSWSKWLSNASRHDSAIKDSD